MILVACNNDEEQIANLLVDGFYQGSFSYTNMDYWYLIEINRQHYEEWPSGGVMFQKSMGCLTTGSYLIHDNKITFDLDSLKFEDFPEQCITDMFLPGDYQIIYRDNNDSIVFSKLSDTDQITYKLKRKNFDNCCF